MKNALILFGVKPKNLTGRNWEDFSDLVQKSLGSKQVKLSTSALSELTYYVDGDDSKILIRKSGEDIAEFDLVIFVYTGSKREYAIAAARYLEFKSVPFIDRYLKRAVPSGKLACAMQRSLKEVEVVPTLGATSGNGLLNSIKFFDEFKNFPLILKADVGRKGQNNFLVRSREELREALNENKDVRFVLQPYIENDGDYRLLLMGSEVRLGFKRSGDKSKTHLNNTSSGAKVTKLNLRDMPEEALSLTKRAAAIDRLSVAGVDLIQDLKTGKWLVLEVNISPQLITGEFASEKIEAYSKMIKELIEKASGGIKLSKNKRLEDSRQIGRREWAGVLESDQVTRAKMDTGAYWSTLHVKEAKPSGDLLEVIFDNDEVREFAKFRRINVAPTSGEADSRFTVKLNILLGDESFETDVTLTQRHGLRYKLLLGRRALRQGGFVVDPARSFYFGKKKEEVKLKLEERSKKL